MVLDPEFIDGIEQKLEGMDDAELMKTVKLFSGNFYNFFIDVVRDKELEIDSGGDMTELLRICLANYLQNFEDNQPRLREA